MFILKRYFKFYKNNGLLKSLVKIISTPVRLVNKMNYQKIKKDIFNENSTKKTLKQAWRFSCFTIY